MGKGACSNVCMSVCVCVCEKNFAERKQIC